MAATPKYLTGDSAGIKEFIDKFDVSDFTFVAFKPTFNDSLAHIKYRRSCSTAMVSRLILYPFMKFQVKSHTIRCIMERRPCVRGRP